MSLNKIGSPEKIKLMNVEGVLSFDPNILVKKIKDTWNKSIITIDQIHEFAKSAGIINYSSEDLNKVINLLKSSGVEVKPA